MSLRSGALPAGFAAPRDMVAKTTTTAFWGLVQPSARKRLKPGRRIPILDGMNNPGTLKLVNPDNPPAALDAAGLAAIAALARRQIGAQGLVMRAVSYIGGQVEDGLKLVPKGLRDQIDIAARAALLQSYRLAEASRRDGVIQRRLTSDRAHRVLAAISGALGGLGGLPTALAELPVATTVIFRAVQGVAAAHGEDITTEATRLEVLRVFGAGGPGAGDDGIDTTFLGARLSLSGTALYRVIAQVAPRFGLVLSQKLMAQALPILGAAAGAGTNYAFVGYYTEMAHVHFGLRALIRAHGDEAVLDQFHKVLAEARVPVRRA